MGAELVALKVVHLQPEAHWDGGMNHDRTAHAKVEAQQLETAQAQVDAVRESAQGSGLKVTALTAKAASVADAIIDCNDRLQGAQRQTLARDVGDFVVKRAADILGIGDLVKHRR